VASRHWRAFSISALAGPGGCLIRMRGNTVARGSPGEFIRQVQAETKKVVWPTGRETMMTAVMVLIMTSVLAIFFLGIDSAFSAIVKSLLSLLG
jgi:preprotein translocase subunit SecE